jgi:hypothetical protein
MPYALFCQDQQLSQTCATEEEVWVHAAKAGLVVDAVAEEESPSPHRILDRDYTIRPCDGPVGHPPPEEDLGGGDIVSIERDVSTDDDRPL